MNQFVFSSYALGLENGYSIITKTELPFYTEHLLFAINNQMVSFIGGLFKNFKNSGDETDAQIIKHRKLATDMIFKVSENSYMKGATETILITSEKNAVLLHI